MLASVNRKHTWSPYRARSCPSPWRSRRCVTGTPPICALRRPLGKRVGGHDGLGRLRPGVGAQGRVHPGQRVDQLLHRQRAADDAGRGDEHLVRRAADPLAATARLGRTAARRRPAEDVGVAGIDEDGARLSRRSACGTTTGGRGQRAWSTSRRRWYPAPARAACGPPALVARLGAASGGRAPGISGKSGNRSGASGERACMEFVRWRFAPGDGARDRS